MKEVAVHIKNKFGLHARPAALLVKTASKFKSDVFISRDSQVVNGKSIMGVMMLAAENGAELTISANGDDESEAVDALIALFEQKFNEE
ncbi:MAG: HPr family phosphocarrier protein [Deferribacteres bacterium]|nr:HPr family phosphocarrier protein [candidate division KSB1 bacterium]MCB9512218.1 HPr family phosphocarrier protein [Deferribacteres bacterium]